MFFLMALLMISTFLFFSRPRRKRTKITAPFSEEHVEHTPGANKQEKVTETTKEKGKDDGGEESRKEANSRTCTNSRAAERRQPEVGSSTSEPIASEESDEEGEKQAH